MSASFASVDNAQLTWSVADVLMLDERSPNQCTIKYKQNFDGVSQDDARVC